MEEVGHFSCNMKRLQVNNKKLKYFLVEQKCKEKCKKLDQKYQ